MTAADTSIRRVLIAVATAPEYRCITRAVAGIRGVSLRQIGIGSAGARRVVEVENRDTLAGVISAGTAAGIQPGLVPGTVLLPRRVLLPGDQTLSIDANWHAAVRQMLGNDPAPSAVDLLEVPAVLETPEAKAVAFRRTGAGAADMESGSLAALARDLGVPFLALRVVLDDAQDAVPPAALSAVDGHGDVAGRALVTALLHRPGDLPGLVILMRRFAVARGVLERAVARAAPALIPAVRLAH